MLSRLQAMMRAASRSILLPALAATTLIWGLGPDDAMAASAGARPTLLYGENISFDIFRGGSKIGSHIVNFAEDQGRLTVAATTRLRVTFLFIPAFRFDYRSRETWIDGTLAEVTAETDDNGKKSVVEAVATSGKLEIKGPRGAQTMDGWIFPTNHWNVEQVGSDRLLNTITGQIDHVAVHRRGADTIVTPHGNILAERFEYTGDLHDTHVWYDGAGRWVQMSFKARDGSWIEYRCTSCRTDHAGG